MRRRWRRAAAVALAAAVSAACTSGSPAVQPTTAAAVPGVPDVTGAGTTTGSVSIAALQQAAPNASVTATSLISNGLDRGYLLIAPKSAAGPLPLIVVLHGISASATQEVQRDELLPLVQAGRAALVYPAGYNESWNVGTDSCCGTAGQNGVDDVAFVTAVVAAAKTTVAVSTTFLIGFSNGGKMAYRMMCERPQLFTAFAVVSAIPQSGCTAAQPPRSAFLALGSADSELGKDLPGKPTVVATTALDEVAATWRTRNGCSSGVSTVPHPTATIRTWRNCSGGTAVQAVLYPGLAHVWPRADGVGAGQSGATLIWAFFSAHLRA